MEIDAVLSADPEWSRLDAIVADLRDFHPHLSCIRARLHKRREDLESDILYDDYLANHPR